MSAFKSPVGGINCNTNKMTVLVQWGPTQLCVMDPEDETLGVQWLFTKSPVSPFKPKLDF